MNIKYLKRIRVYVSIFFLVLTTFVFIDFAEIFSPGLIDGILYLQFIPSVVAFINTPALWTAGFLFVLILTVFFGRIYCSSICPVGTLQDFIGYLKRKIRKKVRFRYKKASNILRYSILGITVLFLLFGSLFFVDLLDPFSNFGRIASNLFRPVYFFLNNTLTSVLEGFSIYKLYYVTQVSYNWVSLAFPAFFLLVLITMVLWRGRLYCNTICPLGTFLGLISRYSVYKIGIKESECTLCGACMTVCKAECIDMKNRTIDNSRCINCHNCFNACSQNGINYYKRKDKKQTVSIKGQERRNAVLMFFSMLFLTGFRDKKNPDQGTVSEKERKNAITPPGSIGHDHFTSYCTACHLCISACPTQVLKPALLEYGFEGVLQPKMDYGNTFCNYECTRCSEVCPSGAIMQLTFKEKQKVQVGAVRLRKGRCVVYRDRVACGSCAEHCPTKAVSMKPFVGNLMVPVVNRSLCVGCGACEYACPTVPYKAIYVEGHQEHKEAEVPVTKAESNKNEELEEFPF